MLYLTKGREKTNKLNYASLNLLSSLLGNGKLLIYALAFLAFKKSMTVKIRISQKEEALNIAEFQLFAVVAITCASWDNGLVLLEGLRFSPSIWLKLS